MEPVALQPGGGSAAWSPELVMGLAKGIRMKARLFLDIRGLDQGRQQSPLDNM